MQRFDFLGGQAEQEEILRTHLVAYLDVGAVQRADGERPVQRQLHVARARGLGSGSGYLFGKIGSRNDAFGIGYIVIGDEHQLQLAAHLLVVVDDIRDVVDEPDDEFGHRIAGRRLARDDHGARHDIGMRAGTDPVIQGDDMQHVEQSAVCIRGCA